MSKTLEQAVLDRLRDTETRIARGKGDWPGESYVRDHVWDGWIGERDALRRILWEAGIDADAPATAAKRTLEDAVDYLRQNVVFPNADSTPEQHAEWLSVWQEFERRAGGER